MEAYNAILRFARRCGEPALRLAMHAAVPQTFRPELLHLLRINFLDRDGERRSRPADESDVLLAPFCEELGGGYYQFDPMARRLLLDQLEPNHPAEKDEEPRVDRVAALMLRYLERMEGRAASEDRQERDFLAVERWVALSFRDPDGAAEQLAKAVNKAGERGDVAARIRLGALAPALSTPLVKYADLVARVEGIGLLEAGEKEEAERLFEALPVMLRVGSVVVRTPKAFGGSGGEAAGEEGYAFVSCPRQHADVGMEVCAALEAAGVRCWYAHRDLRATTEWWEPVMDALRKAAAVVAVSSTKAGTPEQIKKELALAEERGKPIVRFPLDGLKPPFKPHIDLLVDRMQRLFGAEPREGDVWVNPVDGQRYVWIPPGTFEMGASPDDREADGDEKPQHTVTLTKGFWMGETPVTVEAYRKFAEATGRSMPEEPILLETNLNPGWKLGQVPMTMVSWDDAVAYAQWAGLRLPTEAEWEYAARAWTTGPRYGELDKIAWTANNSGDTAIDSDRIWEETKKWEEYAKRILANGCRPRDVRGKDRNRFGLYDKLGNVWEWTADWYDEKYYASSPREDPQGAAKGEHRSARGGSWLNFPSNARASCRFRYVPAFRDDGIGFRCAGE